MLEWLAGWWNWPFLLSFFVGMGLVGVTILGGGHADHEGGIDMDGDGGHVHHDHDGHHAHGPLAFLGVGKAPLSVLLEVLLVSFGLIGLIVNAIARDVFSDWGRLAFPVALGAAIVGSMAVTRLVAQVFAKVAPADAPTSRKSGEFTGSTGIAATSITHTIGQVNVTSEVKTAPSALLNACVDPEWPSEIARGTEVHLVAYDVNKNLYKVRPLLTA